VLARVGTTPKELTATLDDAADLVDRTRAACA
jgi:hypothetical protein